MAPDRGLAATRNGGPKRSLKLDTRLIRRLQSCWLGCQSVPARSNRSRHGWNSPRGLRLRAYRDVAIEHRPPTRDRRGSLHIREPGEEHTRNIIRKLSATSRDEAVEAAHPAYDLIELRHTLEVRAARLAANRATAENVERLGECLKTMESHIDVLPEFAEADMMFHVEVVEASGNLVLRDLLQSVRALLRVWVDRVLRDPDEAKTALDQHTTVLRAIESRDAEAAGDAMDAHMVTAGERLLRVIRN